MMSVRSVRELFDLGGKGAVVTGGASGMGEAIARRLAEAGAGVIIVDIDEPRAKGVADEIAAGSGRARALAGDVRSEQDALRAVQAAVEAYGSIDILVNNTGIYPSVPFLATDDDTWDRVHEINLKGVFIYSQVAARRMIEDGHGGKIITVVSLSSVHPMLGQAAYASSKGGVMTLLKSMAMELAAHQILVNGISPGTVWTPGLEKLMPFFCEAAGMDMEELEETSILPRIPLGRMGEPDDVAKVALFLASGASDYMTGQTLSVDGGYMLT